MTRNLDGALSFPVSVKRLPQKGLTVKIEADERERIALRDFHDLQDVTSFKAELQIVPWKKDGIRVRGVVKAKIVQSCVVTSEAVDAVIEAEIDTLFVPDNSKLARLPLDENGELIVSADGPDIPETFSGDTLDAGAIAEEFFELAIDPYPRKEGVSDAPIEVVFGEDVATEKPVNPFASLKDWKQKP
ncbi:YceD family protein [Phyllobacterium sp. OV277]|uniref:YceD family protein n=1 Tax=Phyllobacterium sp. OV277 TaxID=1882772 RepID=UPI000884C3DB|nr:YceD family protein [Phyllobacterium sp. OV277]SDP64784.1 Uncharacterized ACR, COG1399 [Phyllobacterium sp. OV277]